MSVFYRDIDVKISDDKSELSKPLVVYERDRGLEIYFNLIEYAYRFDKNPTNLLDNLVGAYATITLVNPSGDEIRVNEVEITGEAKVKFVITEDLTDELTEIGTYQLQIHVNNDTEGRDTSVFSIPPFNFEVRERLKGKKYQLLDSEGYGLTDEEGYQLMSATANRVINFPANKINEYLGSITTMQGKINEYSGSITTMQGKIEDLNSQLDTIENKQVRLFLPDMSRPCDTAGIGTNLEFDWIKDNDYLPRYLDEIKEFNINKIYLIINNSPTQNGDVQIAYNNKEFNNWQDAFSKFIELLNERNMELLAIKLHTTVGNGCIKLNEITNLTNFNTFENKYKETLNALCSFFKKYTNNVVIFNEMDWLYLDNQYSVFINECFNIIKSHSLNASISTINPYDYIKMPSDVKNNMSYWSTNFYPPASFNGLEVPVSSMVSKVLLSDDYKKGLRYMLSSGKEVYISETGCMDKLDSLAQPWKWNNFTDSLNHHGKIQEIFLEIIFTVFNNNKIKNLCYWFDLDSSLKTFVKKYNGGGR